MRVVAESGPSCSCPLFSLFVLASDRNRCAPIVWSTSVADCSWPLADSPGSIPLSVGVTPRHSANLEAATAHYITQGFFEGSSTRPHSATGATDWWMRIPAATHKLDCIGCVRAKSPERALWATARAGAVPGLESRKSSRYSRAMRSVTWETASVLSTTARARDTCCTEAASLNGWADAMKT